MDIMVAAAEAGRGMDTPFAIAARNAVEAREARRIAKKLPPPPPSRRERKAAALTRLSRIFDRLADPKDEAPRVYVAAIVALAGDDAEVAAIAAKIGTTSQKTPIPFITAPMILRAMGGAGSLR